MLVRLSSVAILAFAMMSNSFAQTAISTQPNVIVILADDLGWTDLAGFGSDFYETPHLDALASEGIKFTQNYSACTVCSPTRAALLTGKYPARLHITDWIPGQMPDNPKLLVPDWTKFLPHDEVTLAEVFKSASYATATIGKWHLGTKPYYPETQGFEWNIAGTDKAAPPSFHAPWKIPTLSEGKDGEYITDRLAEEAVKFIEHNRDKPFFLYLPHFAVHTPIEGRADIVAKYRAKLQPHYRHRNVEYAAMVESLDAAVGSVLSKLKDLEIDNRTIVIFTSDNGGRITQETTTNEPLRFGKASAYEGGVRVPMIIRWPGFIHPGRVTNTPVITMDIYPTVLELAGIENLKSDSLTGDSGKDGVSLVPLLRQSGKLADRDLFWHYPHHQHYQLGGTMPYAAIRSGDYKLIEFFNDMHVELYNLANDISEQRDLVNLEIERANALREKLHAWRSQVGAQMPTPNPAFNPSMLEFTPPAPKSRKASQNN